MKTVRSARCLTAVAAVLLGLLQPNVAALPSPSRASTSDEGPHKLGAVASESDICSSIGKDAIKNGGNAADATVATVICLGTVALYHSGIGGGGFMLVRAASGSYEFIDFRETAPAAAFEDMYKNNVAASQYGGLASGVPGELRGLEYLHKKHGSLPWDALIAPSIDLALNGFAVNHDMVRYMNAVTPNDSFLTNDPSWAVDFAPNGHRVKLGDTITRKRYAQTLKTIAAEGPDAFYTGAIANATIAALQKAGGTMTLDDLKNYSVAVREPAQIDYRGYKLSAGSAPSGGIVVLSALNAVNGYTEEFVGRDCDTGTTVQLLDEAIRFAYGQRSKLGDPGFVDGMDEYTANMISAETGAEIRGKISANSTHGVAYYDPDGLESRETPGTSQVSVADASGLAVSLTTTVNLLFGSQIMVPETGVVMNNEMNDFSVPGVSNAFGYLPSPANFIRPGKRPLSSISNVIAETAAEAEVEEEGEEGSCSSSGGGKPYLVIGAAGGSRIITATIQNVHHVIDRNRTVADALASPRFHDQLSPSVVQFEYAYDNATVAVLRDIGHNVSWVAPGQSSAQGVRVLPDGTFEAAAEPRQVNSGAYTV